MTHSAASDTIAATATFLFTDIQGSTQLLRRLGEQYSAVLLDHRRIVRAAIAAHDGREQGTEGDSFFVLFDNALDGVTCAIDAQLQLSAHDWGEAGTLLVRMGLHTGDVRLTEDGLVGLAVHVAARVGAAGHGGQVIISEDTAHQVEDTLPADLRLHDLGRFRLKDVPRPTHLYQVDHPRLSHDFPPPRTFGAVNGNLPVPATRFIGREREANDVVALLEGSRLVTIAGPGGTGKTRLAIEVARSAAPRWRDGTWLAELAEVTDPAAVTSQVRVALGVSSTEPEALFSYLADQELLLILDNCEHVVAACADVATRVLAVAPRVRILATSRSPLEVDGETRFPLGPLGLPSPGALPAAILESEAAQLLVDRVRQRNPSFAVAPDEVEDLAALCAGLDGNPLALELVASRVGVLSLRECTERLVEVFRLLGGPGTGRHDTLYATIDWSYRMLEDRERELVDRLAVFRGGATLAAVEAVCAPGSSEWEVLDTLGALVSKSLVIPDPGRDGTRYRMLESIRQFCLQRLRDCGDDAATRERHCSWVVELVGRVTPRLVRADPGPALRLLTAEHDNVASAIDWAHEQGDCDRLNLLVGSLTEYMFHAASTHDAVRWLSLARECASRTPEHVDVLIELIVVKLTDDPPDWPPGDEIHRQAVAAAQAIGDRRRELRAHTVYYGELARSLSTPGDYAGEIEKLLPEIEQLGSPPDVAVALSYVAYEYRRRGLPARAVPLLERARALGDAAALQQPYTEYQSAMVSLELGDAAAARSQLERSLAARLRTGDTASTSLTLDRLGVMHREEGDLDEAIRMLEEAVDLERRRGWAANLAIILADLAAARIAAGDIEGGRATLTEAGEKAAGFGPYSEGPVEFVRGDLARALGKRDEAIAHYRESIGLLAAYSFTATIALAEERLRALGQGEPLSG